MFEHTGVTRVPVIGGRPSPQEVFFFIFINLSQLYQGPSGKEDYFIMGKNRGAGGGLYFFNIIRRSLVNGEEHTPFAPDPSNTKIERRGEREFAQREANLQQPGGATSITWQLLHSRRGLFYLSNENSIKKNVIRFLKNM